MSDWMHRRDPMEDIAIRRAVASFDGEFTTDDVADACRMLEENRARRHKVAARMRELIKEGIVERVAPGRFRRVADLPKDGMVRDESVLAKKSEYEKRWDRFKATGSFE